jgi:hypothetical protein
VSENLHELSPEKLKLREVVHIDIANDPVPTVLKTFSLSMMLS